MNILVNKSPREHLSNASRTSVVKSNFSPSASVAPLSKKVKGLPICKSNFHLRVVCTEIHVLLSCYFGVALILCWIILLVVHDFRVFSRKKDDVYFGILIFERMITGQI